jgi:hypothetical protein
MAQFNPSSFAAVVPEEVAFAMTLFMGIASGQITGQRCEEEQRRLGACPCEVLLRQLSQANATGLGESEREESTALDDAIAGLWHQYEGDARRLSLCARVLGFYYLAQRNGGRILDRWVTECVDAADTVMLNPAVVEAIALVPLTGEGRIPEELFFEMVEAIDRS